MTRTTVRGGPGVRVAAAVSLALLVAGVSACGSPTTAPPTAKVQRGTVANMVSASGALAPVTSQNLGFSKGSKLTELNVRVGDVVKPGQLLAREDDFSFQQTLAQQKAALDGAQANLDKATNSPLADGSRRAADQGSDVYDKAQKVYDKTVDLSEKKLDNARHSYKTAAKMYNSARKAYYQCLQDPPPPPVTEDADQAPEGPMGDDSAAGATSTGSGSSGSGSATGASGSGGLLGGLSQAMGDCSGPKGTYDSAKTSLGTARDAYKLQKESTQADKASAQQTRESAQLSLIQLQNTADLNDSDRPSLIASAAASVASAQAQVAQAQRDVDNTLLYAPVGGTVSTITGTVGEYMAATSNGNTSALAPGSAAAIPGVGAAATSDASGNASSGLSATRPGGGAFISLNNLSTFQVVVPFEESDAAKVQPNQKVEVSFDAVPDLTRDGTVLSIAPSGTNISGVTNYYATILLTNTDPRLKAGQTAEAGVMTNTLDNVLVVPNSAVIKQGNGSFVNTPGADGKPVQTKFEPGMVGDNNTQVLSGLREGQDILMPQAQVSPAQGGGRK